MYECLSVSNDEGVRRITLNRPEFGNAQNVLMLQELDAAMREAEADADVRVVILAGAGKHFSAGHDLKEGQEKRSNLSVEERWAHEDRHYFEYSLRIRDLSKPTIAEVQGACIAAGFMVANMCDLIVASEDAFFSDPVVNSIGAAAVEVLIHPWVLGVRKAKEFLFTGGRVTAAEALQLGMVNRVVPRDDLRAETDALARKIANAPPFGVLLTKRSINRTADMMGLRSSLEAHFDTHQLSHFSQETQATFSGGLSQSIERGKALSS